MSLSIRPSIMILQRIARKITTPLIYSRALFETACQKSIFVFNYHEISDQASKFSYDFGLNVSPTLFREQLSWIKKYFQVISPNQLINKEFDLPVALITFDDGFASTFQEGALILRDEVLPATVFVNMAPVEGQVFWSGLVIYLCSHYPEFKKYLSNKYRKIRENLFLYCTVDDVNKFVLNNHCNDIYVQARIYYGKFASHDDLLSSAELGLYLGNHLYNHYNSVNISLDELKTQYLTNERALLNYDNYVSFFSYPFGQPESCYNNQTDELIFSLGASRIFTAFSLPNKNPEATRLHRISMNSSIDDEISFKYNCIVLPFYNSCFRRHKFSYV